MTQRPFEPSARHHCAFFSAVLCVIYTRAQAGINKFMLLCNRSFRKDFMEEEVGITALLPVETPADTCE